MYTRRLCLGFLLSAGMLAAQEPATNVQVTGAVKQPLTLSADDLARMPVTTTSNGMQTKYEGVWLHEVLNRAGAPQDETLRGKALAGFVLAEAQDGYQVVFSLGELDPAFIDNEILLATRRTESLYSVRRAAFDWSCRRTSQARVLSEC